uniref:Uncharacterized protein n=1 Tax=Zeugodacus cucurbitae TaxID=28588 RepID=A0A0A1XTH8_ZEUCU
MRCPNIVGPSTAIAVAVVFGCFALFLAPCCLAAAAIDTEGLPQELLVPFNDLLPPLSDAELQTTTTTTTTAAPPVTVAPVHKPATTTIAPNRVTTAKLTKSATAQKLKKTQYQLDQQLQKQQPAVPILDLNPEVPPALPEGEAPVATEAPEAAPVTPKAVVAPTTRATPRPTPAATQAPIKVAVKVPEPKQAASTQHFQQVQAAQTATRQELQQHLQPQEQQQYKQQQQQKQQFAKPTLRQPQPQAQHRFQPQVAAAITRVAPPSTLRNAPAETQVNVEQLRQYLEYIYHPTTRRPSRGPLPTLTPFPRHLK